MVAAVNTSLRLGKVQCHLLPARTTLLTLQGTLSAPGSTPLLILVRVLGVGVENKAQMKLIQPQLNAGFHFAQALLVRTPSCPAFLGAEEVPEGTHTLSWT